MNGLNARGLVAGLLWIATILSIAVSAAEPAVPPQPGETTTRPVPGGETDGGQRGSGHRFRGRVTPQQETEILEFLKQRRPEHYRRLVRMREDDPQGYQRSLRAVQGFIRRLRRMPEQAREAALREKDARIRVLQLLQQYQQTQDPRRAQRLEVELRQAVAEQLEAEQIIREQRLAELEQQIAELRRDLAERRRQRDRLLEERVAHLLHPAVETQPAGVGEEPTSRPAQSQ